MGSYVANIKDIQEGKILKSKYNILYKIVRVKSYESARERYEAGGIGLQAEGKWRLEVQVIKGVNFEDGDDANKEYSFDTTFTMRATPNEILAMMNNFTDAEATKLSMLGLI